MNNKEKVGEGKKKTDSSKNVQPNVLQLVGDLNRRVRGLEESFRNTRERLDIVDDSLHDNLKNLRGEFRELSTDLTSLKNSLNEVKLTFSQMIKQLSVFARKSDVLSLEKYIDLMDPTKYLTENDVKILIEKELNNKKREEVVLNS